MSYSGSARVARRCSMMSSNICPLLIVLLVCISAVASRAVEPVQKKSALLPYQPYLTQCPGNVTVRKAGSTINSKEDEYRNKRKAQADVALQAWLQRSGFNSTELKNVQLPTLGLALGGGGPRAALLAAGVLQALDARDSAAGTAGVLQSLTYLTGLSGGSLTLAGVVGNDLETISVLRENLFDTTFLNLAERPVLNIAEIVADVAAKLASGSPASLIDVYGRALGYDVIGGVDGASGITVSGLVNNPSFLNSSMPYPIIQSTAVDFGAGQCYPTKNSPLFEFSPYEFGSWEDGVASFIPTQFMGTSFVNGKPVVSGLCTQGFDNLGWTIGTSANILADSNTSCPVQSGGNGSASSLWFPPAVVHAVQDLNIEMSLYGILPNPFKGLKSASKVAGEDEIYLIDGGDSGLPIPYWSLLQPARNVDVIIAADLADDGSHNVTSGSSLANTYDMAQAYGIKRMPKVPTLGQIQAQNLTDHARFFGCNELEAATLVWLPDTYATNFTSGTFFFDKTGIDQMVLAGQAQSTQANASEWPSCLACAITMKKLVTLPEHCNACKQKYCWNAS